MRQNWSRFQFESLIHELEERIDRLEREAEREGQLLRERQIPTGTGAGGPPSEPTSDVSGDPEPCEGCARAASSTKLDVQAKMELGMGAKPPHGHCHHCGIVARVDPEDECAGCGEAVWSAGISNPLYTAEATYAEDMIQAENELLQHISETQLSGDQPTNIPRSAQEEIAQRQASLGLVLLAEESAQTRGNEYSQLLDMQLAEALRSAPEELVQLQYSTDEEDAYEDAYENYTTHISPWNPCQDSDGEGKENPGDLKDDSVL